MQVNTEWKQGPFETETLPVLADCFDSIHMVSNKADVWQFDK